MIDLSRIFDRVLVVNLDRRPDRWRQFEERAAVAGITGFERFKAVDGLASPKPPWFTQQPGAWGALCSHYRIAQDAAGARLRHYLVFEDDVVFRAGFAERLVEMVAAVENTGWDMLYFGGSHLEKPVEFRPGIVRGMDINRLHAYAVAAPFYDRLIARMADFRRYQSSWHVDHAIGSLHPDALALAAEPWLCGQGTSFSDIGGMDVRGSYWDLVPSPKITISGL